MKKQFLSIFGIVAIVLGISLESRALTLNPFKRSGRVKASSLMITGNYVDSRLLAELAQHYSKQPLLVISPDVDGGYQLFFMPATKEAKAVSPDEFVDIIEFVGPKRIIILGNESFVPMKFVDQARANYSIISLDSDNWSKNAAALGDLLKIEKLQTLFDEYKKNIDSVAK
ncbi:MAG: hypothetical protein J5833_01580 [Victivallales bacterium]|nr:hypothetical protein [Victivallales bacterium]